MKIIDKEDLREPYSSLTPVLRLDEIDMLAQMWQGRQILFSSQLADSYTYTELVETFDNEKADRIIDVFRGELVYFPRLKSATVRDKILRDFTGYNYTELSRKYGYSERYIREIVKCHVKEKNAVLDGQISLFDKN